MSNKLPDRPAYTYTADDWNQLRAHFMGSILVDIHLHKLAQNIGLSWPAKGKDETPAKYLEYSFEELSTTSTLAAQPARLQLLLDILKETASFDDPFQEMIDNSPDPSQTAAASDKLLLKLSIPPDFPLEFTALSPETKSLCHGEGAVTIGQCVALFQRMAQNVILGGEIRHLLNCLAHGDEAGLASFLPLRAGARGLHLAEAIGLMIRNLPETERIACLVSTSATAEAIAAEESLLRQIPQLLEWFPTEAIKLKETVFMEESVERYFHSLNDPALEQAAARIAQHFFKPPPPEPVIEEEKPAGLFQRVAGFFGSKR